MEFSNNTGYSVKQISPSYVSNMTVCPITESIYNSTLHFYSISVHELKDLEIFLKCQCLVLNVLPTQKL